MRNGKCMRIGAVVELSGLCANTIRRLEHRGLLHPARDWAGQRRFTDADVRRLQELAGTATIQQTVGKRRGGARRVGS
jgi:hypothetical protein